MKAFKSETGSMSLRLLQIRDDFNKKVKLKTKEQYIILSKPFRENYVRIYHHKLP